jgi:hypothetical protein
MSADFVGLHGVVFHKIRLFEYLLLLRVHTSKKTKVEHEEMMKFLVIFSSSAQMPA